MTTFALARVLFSFNLRCENDSRTNSGILGGAFERNYGHNNSGWLQFCPTQPRDKAAHSNYFVEYHEHVQRFLFDAVGSTGCYYLRRELAADVRVANDYEICVKRINKEYSTSDDQADPHSPTLRGLQLLGVSTRSDVWKSSPPSPDDFVRFGFNVGLEPDTGIELWFSRMGIGVLSFSFCCQPTFDNDFQSNERRMADLLTFNHALATGQKAVWLRAKENPTSNVFHVHQWARELIEPLVRLQNFRVQFEQRGLVHTVLRLPEVDRQRFGHENQLAQQLSHLANIHPASHPGEVEMGSSRMVAINSRHTCHVAQSGAAHATWVGDDNGEYDTKRIIRAHTVYFSGFLLAQLQRLCLQRFLEDSVVAANESHPSRQASLYQRITAGALRFGVEGDFASVSWRAVCQDYYESVQQACRIQPTRQALRQSLGDFDRSIKDEQAESSESTMQIVEAFIVTIYSVELSHILAECFHFGHTPQVGWSLIGVAVATFVAISVYIARRSSHERTLRKILTLFLFTSLIQFVFLWSNGLFKVETSQHFPPKESVGSINAEENHEPQ